MEIKSIREFGNSWIPVLPGWRWSVWLKYKCDTYLPNQQHLYTKLAIKISLLCACKS